MTATARTVVIRQQGGPEVLEIDARPLGEPKCWADAKYGSKAGPCSASRGAGQQALRRGSGQRAGAAHVGSRGLPRPDAPRPRPGCRPRRGRLANPRQIEI